MRSWGEIIRDSALEPGASNFWGGYQIIGTSVPVSRVPPEVIAAIP
jgi:hypothetical protein